MSWEYSATEIAGGYQPGTRLRLQFDRNDESWSFTSE